jgi:hypothetical protein
MVGCLVLVTSAIYFCCRINLNNIEPDASASKTLLEKASKAEQAVQAERIQMQQVIDTKQRLIEKQVITFKLLNQSASSQQYPNTGRN